jgi:DNA repair protein RecN (Recombination protein N)
MLKSLYIKNIALIDEANIEFSNGLNILSGETGAGKSIVIDSLIFVLGSRADKTLIKSGETSAFAEAVFQCEENNVFQQNGYESEDNLFTVSRIMSVGGKNEIRINGRIASQSVLKQISASLVDVFGQNEQTYLLRQENHLGILDGFGDNAKLKNIVYDLSVQLDNINKQLDKFGGDDSERERLADMLSFQINEIESAELFDGEDEDLSAQRQKAKSMEKITYACSSALSLLSGENSSLDKVSSALNHLVQIDNIDKEYETASQRLSSVKYELQDICETVENFLSELKFDQYEMDMIENRLDKIKLLKKKYGGSIAAVLDFCNNAKQKLDELTHSDEIISQLKEKKENILLQLYAAAKNLSLFRRETATKFENKIMTELQDLGMKNTTFAVVFSDMPQQSTFCGCGKNGFDKIEFYFSANKGEPIKPLTKIISGGEMSRFMLALKNITATIEKIPTMVFDEIDSGISGKIAEVVGCKLAKISKNYQCIVITHLPQIASMSDAHLLIEKSVTENKTKTTVTSLNFDGKLKEVGRLVGGDIGEYGQLHAKDLIQWADNYKKSL